MEAVVQHVRTWWTVRSRGQPAATVRNATPTAFPLPPDLLFAVHEIVMREHDDFRPRARQTALPDPDLPVHIVGKTLRVRPPKIPLVGFPRRNRHPPAVRLAPGQCAPCDPSAAISVLFAKRTHITYAADSVIEVGGGGGHA